MSDALGNGWGGQDEKAAHNQSLFRMVNEQVRKLHTNEGLVADFGPPVAQWVCECANAGCMERLDLTIDEYAHVRAAEHRFLVAATDEHVFLNVEEVTERYPNYWVVEKTGRAREIVAALYEGSVAD